MVSANRAEPLSGIQVQYGPCRCHGLWLGRWGTGARFVSLREPNQQEALCASDNPIFKMDLTALKLTQAFKSVRF